MSKLIILTTEKGGTGKTTTVKAFGCILQQLGFRVLLIDADPQVDLTFSFGAMNTPNITLYDVITSYMEDHNNIRTKEAIIHTGTCDVLKGDFRLSGLVTSLQNTEHINVIYDCVMDVDDDYDFIIVDTNPFANDITMSAGICADYYMGASNYSSFAGNATSKFINSYNTYKAINEDLENIGVLITRAHSSRKNFNRQFHDVYSNLKDTYNIPIFPYPVRENVRAEEMHAYQEDFNDITSMFYLDYYQNTIHFLKNIVGVEPPNGENPVVLEELKKVADKYENGIKFE